MNVTWPRVLHSEWIKMRSLRSTWFTLAGAVLAVIVIGTVVGYATNAHWSSLPPEDRAQFEPIGRTLVGVNLAQLIVGVLGVLLISGEYATGMVRATFAAVPRRLPVLTAKAVLYAVLLYPVLFLAVLAAFEWGEHGLGSHGTTLSAPHALRAVLGAAAYLDLVGLLALALGFIIRSTAGGIATLVGLLLILPGIGQALPTDWRRHTVPYLPSQAGGALYIPTPQDPGSLHFWAGGGVLCLWVAAALILAGVVLKRRDV
ncbi:MAG: transporter permease [Frankiales bacterium]|nr:transporter permease [Frankiales bacterium]